MEFSIKMTKTTKYCIFLSKNAGFRRLRRVSVCARGTHATIRRTNDFPVVRVRRSGKHTDGKSLNPFRWRLCAVDDGGMHVPYDLCYYRHVFVGGTTKLDRHTGLRLSLLFIITMAAVCACVSCVTKTKKN